VRGATRGALGGLLALALMGGIGGLTRFAYVEPGDEAALRLAWRARVPRVEECRELTAEEQAELPAHMRRDEVCEGRVASYRLEVAVDGRVRHRALVSGAGARGDRPLYVFETLPLDPGRHRIRVVFARIDEGGSVAGEGASSRGTPAEAEDAEPGTLEPVPERLVLERTVEVKRRDVVLVSYDPVRRTLVLR
jgi:hypothetical protein